MSLNGVGHAPVETRTHRGVVFAKLGDDGLLTFLHDEKACGQPDQHGTAQDDPNAQVLDEGRDFRSARTTTGAARTLGALATAFAAKNLTQLAVEVAPQFVQIRRSALLLLWAPAGGGLPGIRLGPGRWHIARWLVARITGRFVIVTSPAGVVQVEHASDLCGQQGPSQGWQLKIHGSLTLSGGRNSIVPNLRATQGAARGYSRFNSRGSGTVNSARGNAAWTISARAERKRGKPSPLRALKNTRGTGSPSSS